jgi:hypothetical protein
VRERKKDKLQVMDYAAWSPAAAAAAPVYIFHQRPTDLPSSNSCGGSLIN